MTQLADTGGERSEAPVRGGWIARAEIVLGLGIGLAAPAAAQQASFVWHRGPEVFDPSARQVANPFRTRLGTSAALDFQIIPFFEDFPGIVGGRVVPDLDNPTYQRLTSLMLDDARAAMVPGRRRDPVSPLVQAFFDDPLNTAGTGVVFPDGDFFPIGSMGRMIVGGDISQIVPCFIPGENDALSQLAGVSQAFNCFKEVAGFEDQTPLNVRVINESSRRNRNRSDPPMRPGPDLGNLDPSNADLLQAQGCYLPSAGLRAALEAGDPSANGFVFSRNVDPATGRPRVADSTGSCSDAGTTAAADPVSDEIALARMGVDGVGRDADCLKPGGAAGEANENGLDPSTGEYGALTGSSPQNALEHHHADQQRYAALCNETLVLFPHLDPSACLWTLFSSPSPLAAATQLNAVEGISGFLAGETSGIFLVFARAVTDSGLGSPVQTPPLGPGFPLAPLNRDPGDGRITALTSVLNGPPLPPLAGDPSPQTRDQRLLQQDAFDLLTIDSATSDEQRAAFGCGPLWGTRCDSSLASRFRVRTNCTMHADGSRTCPDATIAAEFFYPEGPGGIDPLNGEASAMLWAAPGGGTDPGWTTTTRTLGGDPIVQPGALRWDPATSTSVGFGGPPVCTREVGGDSVVLPGCRGIQQIVAFTDGPDLLAGTVYEDPDGEVHVVYDAGFDPNVDGCPLSGQDFGGRTIVAGLLDAGGGFVPFPVTSVNFVRARRCGNPAIGTGGRPDSGNRSTSRISNQVVGQANVDLHVQGGRTLFHPLAGCLEEDAVYGLGAGGVLGDIADIDPDYAGAACHFIPASADPGTGPVVLDATGRDFAAEFLAGTAQIFRSELAALSWNFLMLLAIASCDLDLDDVGDAGSAGHPECFNPARPWQPASCSFAAPQLCRNVKLFRALATPGPDADGDGIPDPLDNCLLDANLPGRDSDADGIGDRCNQDYDGSGIVDLPDFAIFKSMFGQRVTPGVPPDHNGDGGVGIPDFAVFARRFGQTPGPSGLACAGSVPCPTP